jgi:hypothetical protein
MIELTISCSVAMGPLDVSVYPPDESEQPFEFTLSSGTLSKTLPAHAGRYTVIARRPNGSKLRRNADVSNEDMTVNLAEALRPVPNPKMQREIERGDIALPTRTTQPSFGAPLSGVFASILGNAAVRAIVAGTKPPPDLAAPAFRTWRFDGRGWQEAQAPDGALEVTRADDLYKVTIRPAAAGGDGAGTVRCISAVDGTGFGPHVMLPPFADPVELTFVKKGLSAYAIDRGTSPGQQRVPVAVVNPARPAVADLLSALASPITQSAETIWSQVSPDLVEQAAQDTDTILAMLLDKFRKPAEALIAAHYLLRFSPARLPLEWAGNLCHASPYASDGPVIAAWAWIYNRPKDASDDTVSESVSRYLSMALERPVTLFARSRTLLIEARWFAAQNPALEARWTDMEVFWRAGAGAGGLEAFWGRAPDAPGHADHAGNDHDIPRDIR